MACSVVLAGPLALSLSISAATQESPEQTLEQTLKVGTSEIEPFVSLEDATPYGYDIELWNKIADELAIETEWVPYESFAEMMDDLAEGELDAAVAGISITAARESGNFDFSYPTYRSGLQLMMRSPQKNAFATLSSGLMNWNIWRPLLLVMATSAGVGALIWLLEHQHNEHFSENPIRGIGQGMWFAIVTLGTFGYGDVTPARLPGRIIACLWMGASFFIVADFIASLTVEQMAESSLSFDDIRGEPVGVIDGTTAEEYVRSQPVQVAEYDSFRSLLAALEAEKVDAVVYDYPTLKYIADRNPTKFELAGEPLTREDYGVAFREGSDDMVEAVTQEILALQEQGYIKNLREKWFGEDDG